MILKNPYLSICRRPILIPLIPGGDLYHMMSNLVRGNDPEVLRYGRLLLLEAGAIALGIICVASFMSILTSLRRRRHS